MQELTMDMVSEQSFDLNIYNNALNYFKNKLHKCFENGGCKWFGNGCKNGNSIEVLEKAAKEAAISVKQNKVSNNIRLNYCDNDGTINCPYPGGPKECWDN